MSAKTMRCLALVAYGHMEKPMEDFVKANQDVLRKFRLMGTGSTITMLKAVLGDTNTKVRAPVGKPLILRNEERQVFTFVLAVFDPMIGLTWTEHLQYLTFHFCTIVQGEKEPVEYGPVCCSGPLGGFAQIATQIVLEDIGGVLLFSDPLSVPPYQVLFLRHAYHHSRVHAPSLPLHPLLSLLLPDRHRFACPPVQRAQHPVERQSDERDPPRELAWCRVGGQMARDDP